MQIKKNSIAMLAAFFFLSSVFVTKTTAATPADVSGTWTVNVSGDAGSAQQTIVLKQDAGKVTGTFKGPRQSGTLEGTVDGNNIKFHVNTSVPFDYTGTIDGDSMKGTLTARSKTGDWTAARAK